MAPAITISPNWTIRELTAPKFPADEPATPIARAFPLLEVDDARTEEDEDEDEDEELTREDDERVEDELGAGGV